MAAMINMAHKLRFLICIPFFGMLACGLMLPSDGNHGLTNPKSLSFLGSCYLVLLYFFVKNRFTQYQFKLVSFTIFAITFLFVWLMIGFFKSTGTDYLAAQDQFKVFLITIIFTVITLYLISEDIILPETYIRMMLLFNFTFSFVKVVGVILHLFGIIKLYAIIELTGLRFMSMSITDGLSRLQLSVDIVTPYFIYFMLLSKQLNLRFSTKFKYIYCIISILSILLSFSRVLLGVASVSFFFYWITLNLPKFTKALLFCLLVLWSAVLMIGIEPTQKAIQLRFFSREANLSDQIRTEQIEAMMDEYAPMPTFGKGLGGSAPKYVRDGALTHSYEVQWVAFLMQLGAVGLAILLFPVAYIAFLFLRPPISRISLGFFCLYGIWLLSGFTNPYLISLTSGIIYTAFLVTAQMLKAKTKNAIVAA